MNTNIKRNVIAGLLAVVLLCSSEASAQKIDILAISHGDEAASIKAQLRDVEDKTLESVTARTFYMPTGESTVSTNYTLLGGRYIIATLDYHPGSDYFYRLEAKFSDGTEVKTDMYNESMTEGAVWLSDLPIASTSPSGLEVGVDCLPDGRRLQIHPGSYFEKGIGIFKNGTSRVNFNVANMNEHNAKFTYTMFTIGMQAYAADGSNSNAYSRVIFGMNNAETGSKGNMKCYSNPTRGNAVYYFDQKQANANGINSIFYTITNANGGTNTENDYGVLGACRLYYPVPQNVKESQTIMFDNPGGNIFESSPEVQIGAYASGNTPIFYSIIQGKEIAVLDENNVLRPLPGKKGTVVVEAFTLGDNTYAPASATVSYKFNFGPTVEYAYCHKDGDDNCNQTLFLHIEPRDKQLEHLRVEIFDDVRSFTNIKTYELTGAQLSQYATEQACLYAFPFVNEDGGDIVHRLSYKFTGEEETVTPLSEGMETFLYMSDIPNLSLVTGAGTATLDEAFGNNGRLANQKYSYSKGIGLQAVGSVETPATFSLAPFYKFCTDVAGQNITATRSARVSFQLYNGVTTAARNTGNVSWQTVTTWDYALQSTSAGKTLKITVNNGGDNGNDIVVIGAPRFYYTTENLRAHQDIEWQSEEVVNDYKAFTKQLTATSTSGLPVMYRIVSGHEYARLVDNNMLSVTQMPDSARVIVEAFQPGSKEYLPAGVQTCLFRLRKSVVVERDSRIDLLGGHDVDELIIYADSKSSGQVTVKDGIVNVRTLKLKYTFTPGEWNHIAFPTDVDLSLISDLAEKGYTFSIDDDAAAGTYIIRHYDTYMQAEMQDDSPWQTLGAPMLKGMKGYIMKLVSDNPAPVEITFTISNTEINFNNALCDLYINVNMRNCEPETRHSVYIRPANVKGNTLRVDMRYVPADLSELPLNHAKALEVMRVTHTPVRGAIRLTLPDQTPARVAIFDKKGKKLLKAVNYISPMKIDISDLKQGTYRMVVVYGPASREMEVEL